MSEPDDTGIRRRLKVASRAVAHTVGEGVEWAVSTTTGGGFGKWAGSTHSMPPSSGFRAAPRSRRAPATASRCSSTARRTFPAVAEAIAGARSHVHLLGWCFSPELNLTREEEPVVLRNLLSDVARRIDVRLLVWKERRSPCSTRPAWSRT